MKSKTKPKTAKKPVKGKKTLPKKEKVKKGGKRNGAGRNKIPIDWALSDEMLEAGCDGAAVARKMGCHPDTYYRAVKDKYKIDFAAYKAQKEADGAESLRLKMHREAMKDGNTTERIFLSKNRLGYTDKQNTDITSGGKTLKPLSIDISKISTEALKQLANAKVSDD